MVDIAEHVNVIPNPHCARAPKNAVRTEPATDRDATPETGNFGTARPCECRKKGRTRQQSQAPENEAPFEQDPLENGPPRDGRKNACCCHTSHPSFVLSMMLNDA
jgi:hypothetical protein